MFVSNVSLTVTYSVSLKVKFRKTSQQDIYLWKVKTPRSDVDYSLSPPPRSSVRVACARTQVTFGPTTPAPAPVDRPMDYRVLTYACFAFVIKYITCVATVVVSDLTQKFVSVITSKLNQVFYYVINQQSSRKIW